MYSTSRFFSVCHNLVSTPHIYPLLNGFVLAALVLFSTSRSCSLYQGFDLYTSVLFFTSRFVFCASFILYVTVLSSMSWLCSLRHGFVLDFVLYVTHTVLFLTSIFKMVSKFACSYTSANGIHNERLRASLDDLTDQGLVCPKCVSWQPPTHKMYREWRWNLSSFTAVHRYGNDGQFFLNPKHISLAIALFSALASKTLYPER